MKRYTFILGESLKRVVEIPEHKNLGDYFDDTGPGWVIPIDDEGYNYIVIYKRHVRSIIGPVT